MTVKILVPVDGSACSLRAVDHVIAHAGWLAEVPEIHLLHVHAPVPLPGALAHVGPETLNAHYREESEGQMAEARRQLDAAGRAYTPHIHVGAAAEVICRQAADLGCDLIVMGSHGRSAVASLVAGSVAMRVLSLAHCPVLLVK